MTQTFQTNQTEGPDFTDSSNLTNHALPKPLEFYSQLHQGKTDQSVYTNWCWNNPLTTAIHLTPMMTSAQVGKMSVTTTNDSS